MKVCASCTAEQLETSRFCSECGAALEPEFEPTLTHAADDAAGDTDRAAPSDSSHHGRFLPGTKVADRYRIVSLVGRGGMGEVYRADDLKPANVMVDGRGTVRITDFGLARFIGDDHQGQVARTPAYMAPEIVHLSAGKTIHHGSSRLALTHFS